MAIAIALPVFNDLTRLVTPIFLLMYYFLYHFSMFGKKRKKIFELDDQVLLQNTPVHQILSSVALCLSVQLFQMPLEGLSFVKMLITFGIISLTDLLL